MAALTPQTEAFLQHLHRGGRDAYYWVASDERDAHDQPRLKRTVWWEVNGHVPHPPDQRGNRLHVYFGINPVDAIPQQRISRRTGEAYIPRPEYVRPTAREISVVNCIFADFDVKMAPFNGDWGALWAHIEAIEPPASVIVETGGGYHAYWLLAQPYALNTEERRERMRHAWRDFAARHSADPAIAIDKMGRLPGSRNVKAKYGPAFPEVRFVRYDLTRTYLLDDLQPARPPRAAPVFAWDRGHGGDEAEKARRALDRLSRWRVDTYSHPDGGWIEVGLALRDLGDAGLRLWDEWSRRSAAYQEGACDRKWPTFFSSPARLGLGSLFHWAKEDDPGGEPRRVRPLQREVRTLPRAAPSADDEDAAAGWLSVDAARDLIRREIAAYLANPLPTEVLVIAAPAGIGKSHIAVDVAEQEARRGRRALYCAPRRNFFEDVVAVSRKLNGPQFDPLSLWYPWEGRTTERADGSTPCLYPEAMTQWLAKGHGALSLCSSRLCGWEYVSGPNACPYHAQKDRSQPILFAQHAHAVLGHPLLETCHLVIGDEAPIESFTHRWRIPRRHIVPTKYPPDDPMAELLRDLEQVSQRIDAGDLDRPLSGPELLTELGGAQVVAAAVANPTIPLGAPHVSRQADVREADYNHVAVLAALLQREAEEALAGRAYIRRVVVTGDALVLHRGYLASSHLPPHVIWLDATANEGVYKELFWPRPVRVVAPRVRYQGRVHVVTDRSWSKWSLVRDGEQGAELVESGGQPRAEQLQRVVAFLTQHGRRLSRGVDRPYDNPRLVTYKDLGNALFGDMERLHFYGNRGSNALETCDALFVAGTPQPARLDLLIDAGMVFKRRMRAFDEAWVEVGPDADQPPGTEPSPLWRRWTGADGSWEAYAPVGMFADSDLATLHWQKCEAELIQALNRARPLVRDVDIWLLANRPLDGVPVTRLWTLRELFGAPEGVDVWLWQRLAAHEPAWHARGPLSSATVAGALGCAAPTARRLCEGLVSTGRWRLAEPGEVSRTRGRPPLVIVPVYTKPNY